MTAPPGGGEPRSAWAPFANRSFLTLWVANVASDIGGWMQTTGAAWEMTSFTSDPLFVALLSVCSTLPLLLFSPIAGVLADRFDRRRFFILWQIWTMAAAAFLALLAWSGRLDPWWLLGLTFCMGIGHAMKGPAWHAMVPEVVPGAILRQAIALNSAGFNLARTLGPMFGQFLLGFAGVALLFAINAVTYVGTIMAMLSWRRPAEARADQRREGFMESFAAGLRFVRGSVELKAIFTRGLCFFVPGIAFGTLLPVIGRFELGLDAFRFGVLYGVFGAGAVAGAALMPTINRLLGPDRANIWAMGLHAAVNLVAALEMNIWTVGAAVTINGACWITVIANNNMATQSVLPNYMRARGMAVNQMVFFGAMVGGSLLWGQIAAWFGPQTAIVASCAALVPLTVFAATIRLPGAALPRA
ncbi:MAG: MFS transporter [Alphaproteobacteria bacterium]|nr:MFS transporter [Alphaproteobacteria bacterium]